MDSKTGQITHRPVVVVKLLSMKVWIVYLFVVNGGEGEDGGFRIKIQNNKALGKDKHHA
jgi:hypothetical protein